MNMKNMKGFTFIHLETSDIVKKAIKAEHGREFFGSNLNVKQAMKKEDMQDNTRYSECDWSNYNLHGCMHNVYFPFCISTGDWKILLYLNPCILYSL